MWGTKKMNTFIEEFCTDCDCKKGPTEKISNALVGNGFCNDETNNEACNYDNGDCCGTCVNSKYCSECECKVDTTPGFNANAFLGNDHCEDELNHEDCMFDGFDCCGYDGGDYNDYYDILPGDTKTCTECLCKGTISKCKYYKDTGWNKLRHSYWFSECDITTTDPAGVITSPKYPQPHLPKIDCTWLIQVQYGQFIELDFQELTFSNW